MAWVSKKVYAILKGAQSRGDNNANFVDNLNDMSESEVKKALDDFFGTGRAVLDDSKSFQRTPGSFSPDMYEEIMSELSPEKKSSEKTEIKEADKKVVTSQKGVIKIGKLEAEMAMGVKGGVGSINEALKTEKLGESEVEQLAEKNGYNTDGRVREAMREFSEDVTNALKVNTMLEFEYQLPDGSMETVKIYNPIYGDDFVKERIKQGKNWVAEEIVSQKTKRTTKKLSKGQPIVIQHNNEAFIIIGLPGAGKSSTVANAYIEKYGAFEIDSDIFKGKMPESTAINPKTGRKRNNSGRIHDESGFLRDEFEDQVVKNEMKDGKLANLVIPTVGGSKRAINKRLKKYQKMGYKVTLINAFATTDNALQRNKGRFLQTLDQPDEPTRLVGLEEYSNSSVDMINLSMEEAIAENPEIGWAVYDGNVPFGTNAIFVDGSETFDEFITKIPSDKK